jgi:hypothetical protein
MRNCWHSSIYTTITRCRSAITTKITQLTTGRLGVLQHFAGIYFKFNYRPSSQNGEIITLSRHSEYHRENGEVKIRLSQRSVIQVISPTNQSKSSFTNDETVQTSDIDGENTRERTKSAMKPLNLKFHASTRKLRCKFRCP